MLNIVDEAITRFLYLEEDDSIFTIHAEICKCIAWGKIFTPGVQIWVTYSKQWPPKLLQVVIQLKNEQERRVISKSKKKTLRRIAPEIARSLGLCGCEGKYLLHDFFVMIDRIIAGNVRMGRVEFLNSPFS